MTKVILTLVGTDRPGLVSQISDQLAAHGGSWTESRLAHLAGQFTGIVVADVPSGAVDVLRQALSALGDADLSVVLHRPTPAPPVQDAPLVLTLVCQDRPGIIRDITRVLAAAQVNIEELTTDVLSGSFSGEAMFRAEARLRLPAGGDAQFLRRELEKLGNELMVDIELTAPDEVAELR